jgi:hypothetical protein
MFFGLALQATLSCIAAVIVWKGQGSMAAVAWMYGGGVAVLNSGMLVLRWYRGLRDYHCDGERHLRSFYRSGMERFFVVGIALSVGLVGLDLSPPPMLFGFIAGQLAWVIAAAAQKTD